MIGGSYPHSSALKLAQLIRSGEVSSRELVGASLDRIHELNPRLNTFTVLDPEGALTAADAVGASDERPFAGVPIAVKDMSAPLAGWPQSFGSKFFGNYTPDHDAFIFRRMKEAGFIIVGKTNAPELALVPVTEPLRWGPARNPWDLSRTTGGSSGGSAAAVAAGMVPLAHTDDGGGSTRIPAACCGLVGLAPSRGRISRGPDLGYHILAQDGVVTWTVADTAAMLDILSGYEIGDAVWAPPPTESFAAASIRPPGRLRVAFAVESPLGSRVDERCAAAVRKTAELLQDLGHEVEEAAPPWSTLESYVEDRKAIVAVNSAGLGVEHGRRVTGHDPAPEDLEPFTWEMYRLAKELDSISYMSAMNRLQSLARKIVGFFSTYQILLTPTLGEPPVSIGEIDTVAEPRAAFARGMIFNPFAPLWNVTGQPSISLPLHHDEKTGLPIGTMLVGPPLGEDLLLSLSAQLEQALPWAGRQPSIDTAEDSEEIPRSVKRHGGPGDVSKKHPHGAGIAEAKGEENWLKDKPEERSWTEQLGLE